MPPTLGELLARAPREDLVVADGQSLLFDPNLPRFAPSVHRVTIRGFEDLQTLHLIPKGLNERTVREAIATDDAEVLSIARDRLKTDLSTCTTCTGGESSRQQTALPRVNYARALRGAYNKIRQTYNPQLARTMSESTGIRSSWDDLDAAIVRRWVTANANLFQLAIILLKDIVIMNNATLTLAPTASCLVGNALKIHLGGKLVIKSSNVKIWVSSAQGNILTAQATS